MWRALTEEEHLVAWFPTTIEGELRAGSTLRFHFRGDELPPITGEAIECEAPRVLEFTWGFTQDDTHVPPEYREPHPERARFELVPGVNSLVDDGHPNVRRDGLEGFLYSVRSDLPDAQDGPDIYVATRATTADPWSTPVNLGPEINSPASETRPILSWDDAELNFGSTRQGSSDVYVTSRERG